MTVRLSETKIARSLLRIGDRDISVAEVVVVVRSASVDVRVVAGAGSVRCELF